MPTTNDKSPAARTHLFTYGSLMFEPVWQRVTKGQYTSGIETIEGFVRRGVQGEEYPAVIRSQDPKAVLSGRVYRNIQDDDLKRLDAFEGEGYERITTVTTKGDSVALYLYRHPQRMTAAQWDPEWFRTTGMEAFLRRYPGFV